MTQQVSTAMSVEEMENRITQLKAELLNVKGTTTEVYTRIVGYYRPVRNWNKGKSQEYTERVVFNSPASGSQTLKAAKQEEAQKTQEGDLGFVPGAAEAVSYRFFYRNTCPNCPPVKEFVEGLKQEGQFVNVDEDEGLSYAAALQVYSAPTVVFFDQDEVEIFRAHKVSELEEFFSTVEAVANA